MILLLAFAFLAGIVTILSPCILPVLPIVLSGGISGGKKRPLGIVTGFIASFTFFALFLTSIVRATGIPADSLRTLSVVVIIAFGLSLLIPKYQAILEQFIGKLSNLFASRSGQGNQRQDFVGGLLIGVSLGLVWTPCVGPILASVISLALTGSVTTTAFFITLAYSIGTAIPMLAIVWGGRALLQKVPWLVQSSGKIQKAFGVLMILTAIAIATNQDRKFQAYILTKFPQYGVGLTRFEDNPAIKKQLETIQKEPMPKESRGKPMFEILNADLGRAPEFIPGGKWFNVPDSKVGLTLEQLRGKVVLVDFWTYTCINCIRTLPYLKNWYAKYKEKGFVIVGVHTPEFEFEKDPTNVANAIKDFGLEYPIVQDNDYATWNAYKNRYWPAEYLVDKDGKIRHTHFGEGNYDETERAIQELLAETGSLSQKLPINNTDYTVHANTPETYLGYQRIGYFTSPEGIKNDMDTQLGDKEKTRAIKEAIEQIRDRFGEGSIMKLGDAKRMNVDSISTGVLSLDIILGVGGMPRGRIIEVYGPESSGKTTLTQHVIAEVQKLGGIAAFVDAEHALDPEYSRRLGINVSELLISQPDNGEQALEIVETLVRSNAVDVIVIDSVAALTPKAEIEGDMGDSHMGLQARLMSQALRKLTAIVGKTKTIVIFINQTRQKIGVYFGNPETTTGGTALKFYSSIRVEVRKAAQIKLGDKVIGGRVKVKIVKNKVAAPFQTTEFDIMYNEGISLSGDLLDTAVIQRAIIKTGNTYSYGEVRLGVGREAAKQFLKDHKELFAQIRSDVMNRLLTQNTDASVLPPIDIMEESKSDDVVTV